MHTIMRASKKMSDSFWKYFAYKFFRKLRYYCNHTVGQVKKWSTICWNKNKTKGAISIRRLFSNLHISGLCDLHIELTYFLLRVPDRAYNGVSKYPCITLLGR